MLRNGLIGALALLALTAAPAGAATTLNVTETTDAKLVGTGPSCVSASTSGGCTLRAAVELAGHLGGAIRIEVPAGTYTTSLGPLKAGEEVPTGPTAITLVGAGASQTIIQGEAKANIFYVEREATLLLQGATVRDGQEGEGGGVYVEDGGTLELVNSIVTENNAQLGGGLYAREGGTIVVRESTVSHNQAIEGGGIWAGFGSHLTVEDHSTIDHNAAPDEDGGGYGGGIGAALSSVIVSDSAISENTAARGGGGVVYFEGEEQSCLEERASARAQHAHAARVHSQVQALDESLSINASTVSGNDVSDGDGGGISLAVQPYYNCAGARRAPHSAEPNAFSSLVLANTDFYDISQSAIVDNRAEGYENGNWYEGVGGGVSEQGFENDPIVNTTIADNLAGNAGGGVAAWTESNSGTTLTLISDTVADNSLEPITIRPSVKSARPAFVSSSTRGANLATETEQNTDTDFNSYIEMLDTIVAEPEGSTANNCEGYVEAFEPAAYNLDYPSTPGESSADDCGLSEKNHDLVGVNPQLDPAGLKNNGGETSTIALLSTSPAIGVVPLTGNCQETTDGPGLVDQRGLGRPGIAGEGCDIGAYEYRMPTVEKAKEEEPKKEEVKKEETKKEETKKEATPTTTTVTPKSETLPFKAVALCASKRDFEIHIQNVKQFGVVSAVVTVDGKHPIRLSGKRLKAAVNLVGLPKGTFTVEIVAHLRNGHTLHGKRVYHTCHNRLPGHSYLPL